MGMSPCGGLAGTLEAPHMQVHAGGEVLWLAGRRASSQVSKEAGTAADPAMQFAW